MALDVGIDNCVISHYVADNLTAEQKKDRGAFEEMIALAKQKIIELGGPWTSLLIENLMKRGECRTKVQQLKGIIKNWPALGDEKTSDQVECLHKIMQDPYGYDSKQLVNVSRITNYFVTMNYGFYRQFNTRKKDITRQCGINVLVMRPSEFMRDYRAERI